MVTDQVLQTSEDAALGGRLFLRQPRKGHRFGHDAILLAAACSARPGEHLVDQVVDDRGDLRAEHAFSVFGRPFLVLHYRMHRKS